MTRALKAVLACLLAVAAPRPAASQGAPEVNGNTGDLGYTYSFRLPKARGRYQPDLALIYSTASNRDSGYGHGWSLTGQYVERDVRAPPAKRTLWLVRGQSRKLLVTLGTKLRPEVEDSFFEVTEVPTANGSTFTAVDAAGSTYKFDRILGSRAWLTRVTDLDGNVTEYAYDADKSEPTAIRYNLAPNSTFYANEVVLEYGSVAPPQPAGVEAGAYISHGLHLSRVRINGPSTLGTRTTIRGYDLAYTAASVGGAASIAQITEYGLGLASSLPPTVFTYQIAASYSLATPVAAAAPIPATCTFSRYQDIDSDARPDVVCREFASGSTGGVVWVRNVTPIGGSQPSFEGTTRQVTYPATTGAGLDDFDGDGVLDAVGASPFQVAPFYRYIYRGRVVSGNLTFEATPIVLDISEVVWVPADTRPWVQVDLNGDGIRDFARRTNWNCGKEYDSTWADCAWEYGYTELVPGGVSRVVKQPGTLPLVPNGPWFDLSAIPSWTSPIRSDLSLALDVNGDGLPDAATNPGTRTFDWQGYVRDYRVGTGTLRASLNLGNGSFAAPVTWATGIAGYGDGPQVGFSPDAGSFHTCTGFTADDPRYTYADAQDFDGDGVQDLITGSGILWRLTGALVPLAGAPPWGRIGESDPVEWNASGCSAKPCCTATLAKPSPNALSEFLDMNGDGIPDLVTHNLSTPPTVTLAKGRLVAPDSTELPVARPVLLKKVQAPEGATYAIDYTPSTNLGLLKRALRPLVTRISVSGPFIQPSATYHWYAGPATAYAWYDGVKPDDRGFAESWTQDDVTRIVRKTIWYTASHAMSGRPYKILTGSANEVAPWTPPTGVPVTPSVVSWFAEEIYGFGLKRVDAATTAACGAAGMDDTAAGYPLRVIPMMAYASRFYGSVISATDTRIACTDVDTNGNVLASTTTPSVGGVAGKALVTRQTFTGTTQCKNVPLTLQVTRWDGAAKLSEETKLFDASCRLLEQYATGTATTRTNRVTYGYQGPFSQQDRSTTGETTKRQVFDPTFGLHPVEEYTEDTGTTLKTTSTFHWETGLLLSSNGPVLVRHKTKAINNPQAGLVRYYLYDSFGRKLSVGKTAPTGTSAAGFIPPVSQMNDAVEAYQYLDGVSPRAVVALRYSVAKSYSTTGAPASADDASRIVAYRDGLGRTIQVRERLGGGGTAATGARVTVTLGGYKVTKASFLDGVGREAVSLEPFYDAGEAFVDYRTVSIPTTRGTVTAFDAQGRPWCSTYRYISGALPAAGSSCSSNNAASASFQLATETRYGAKFVSSRGPFGGNFVSVESIPPDQNIGGGTFKPTVRLLGPAGEDLGLIDGEENRTWVERDAMGREVASWRESGPRYTALSTPNPASRILYNLAGQVIENWDANSTRVTRKSRYDEAGRLVYVTTDPATGEGIEYYFGSGDLGRVTEVREVTYPVPGGAAVVRKVATNYYDLPYRATVSSGVLTIPDAGYGFVAGRLSWTENADTLIAYGYDDAARVWRRDQWLVKLDPTKANRFTVSSTYGTDGRVLDSRVINSYSAAAEYQYFVDYDSAGRPVALSGKLASQTAFIKVYEVVSTQGTSNAYGGYDALGRVMVMRADDGRAVSARRYNRYSGMLDGECKRFGDAVACGTVASSFLGAAPALDATKDVFRTDMVTATYKGAKLAGFEDSGTATRYTNTYLPNGRLATSKAEPTGTVGSLTQDWLESFFFNGIGNVSRVSAQRNAKAGNTRPDRYETQVYVPDAPASGQALDRVSSVLSQLSSSPTGSPPMAVAPESTSYAYDLLGHLTKVTRSTGETETLVYAPGGELLYRQVGEKFTFFVGEYATVTARGAAGCGASCVPQAATVEMDAHVIYAGTRIASVKPARSLYYYRTRLGTVAATSTRVGTTSTFGAAYRYTPYGEVELSVNETDTTRSELGYTNALRLTGSLLYLKNRVYDAKARVFIQPDVVDRLRYAYVMGDPVNLSDPTGLAAGDWVGPSHSMVPTYARTLPSLATIDTASLAAHEPAGSNQRQVATESSKKQEEDGAALQNAEAEHGARRIPSFAELHSQVEQWNRAHQGPLTLGAKALAEHAATESLRTESSVRAGFWFGVGAIASLFDYDTIGTTFAVAGAVRVPSQSTKGPTFVVTPQGEAIPVPQGATGPVPVVNPQGSTTGFGFKGGSGGLGLDPRASTVRIMDPTAPRGASPGYPGGYVTYQNASGQTVNPSTGGTVARSDPASHIPLKTP